MSIPANPGDILLGKYRVEKVLGKGGMGVVVAVQHVELGQRYAIKFLLPNVQAHPGAIERFLREARAAARLQSEHVARVHDVGYMDNGLPYMVMEYLEGSDLQVILHREGPLDSERALNYLDQVCDAIAEAHAAGIVHRDLKPANLFLIRRRNGAPCVKVLDFGISKHLEAKDGVDLTSTNATVGSPLYMSPEQISQSKSVDPRTDIWSLGVILYELLTGKSPFLATTALEVVARILQEEPMPVRIVRPEVSERAEGVIAGCLRKQREQRFQTIEELQAYLQKRTLPFAQTAENIADTALPAKTSAPSLPSLPSITPAPSTPSAPAMNHVTPVPTSVPAASTGPTSVAFGQTQPLAVAVPKKRTGVAIAAVATIVCLGGGLFAAVSHFSRENENAPAASAMTSASATPISSTISTTIAPPPAEPAPEATAVTPEPATSAISTTKAIATSTATAPKDANTTTSTKKKRSAL